MLLHYLVKALNASCTWNRWLSVPRNTRLYSTRPVASKYPRSEPSRSQDLGYYHAASYTRKKSVAWMNGGRSTSGVTLNSRLSTWLLTTGVEDFERASVRKKDNSNTTCELTILILSASITFSVTFVWLFPCNIFHSKRVPAIRQLGLPRVCFTR